MISLSQIEDTFACSNGDTDLEPSDNDNISENEIIYETDENETEIYELAEFKKIIAVVIRNLFEKLLIKTLLQNNIFQ